MIGHPLATFGHTQGNPIWEEMFEVASLRDPTFILSVTLSEDRNLTRVFAGDLSHAHQAGVEFALSYARGVACIAEAFPGPAHV